MKKIVLKNCYKKIKWIIIKVEISFFIFDGLLYEKIIVIDFVIWSKDDRGEVFF